MADNGIVDAAGSNFLGRLRLATAESGFVDGGGNSLDGEPASLSSRAGRRLGPWISPEGGAGSVRATEDGAESRSEARISIGPGGVRIQGRSAGSVEVGPGGVEIRRPEGSGERKRIESCADLCDFWPALTSGQAECAAVVLEIRGFEVNDHLVCIEVETRSRCAACARVLDLRDEDCLAIVDRCIPRRR